MNKANNILECTSAKANQPNDKKPFVMCQGCQAVHYCSQSCMRKHLKQHAQECKKIKK